MKSSSISRKNGNIGTFLIETSSKASHHSAPERNKATSTMPGKSVLHFHERSRPQRTAAPFVISDNAMTPA
ncbi:Phenylcoumaran benzylic ether reductase [Trichinella spiralis]|uniref:Phenylcoumaran benzylic ether reductase n=1 Tax=Trichinella spiralis TaxID=6334 RepID=A0ABR3KAE9_TRISP